MTRRTSGQYIRFLHFTRLYLLNSIPRSTLYSTSNKTKPSCIRLTMLLRTACHIRVRESLLQTSRCFATVSATVGHYSCTSGQNLTSIHRSITSLGITRPTSRSASFSVDFNMSTRFAIVQRNQSEDKRTLNEEQLPIPKLEKSQVLVKVEKAALNPTDGWYCQ